MFRLVVDLMQGGAGGAESDDAKLVGSSAKS